MSRRTLHRKLDFLLKEFYLTLFPESARTTIGPSTNFFSVGTSKLRSRCPEHISEGKFFEKNSFLKFSIRLWGRLFEPRGENFAARFSKMHFRCHEGTLKQKKFFLFKPFLQVFCEFEQSKLWTPSKLFSGSFVDITFSVSRLAFWEEVFKIS